jgi:two-component system, LytTR family, sensor kinase
MTASSVRPAGRVDHLKKSPGSPPPGSAANTLLPVSRHLASAIVVFALSTAAAFYFAAQEHLAWPVPVRQPWSDALAINLAHYWTWGATVPVVAALARFSPVGSGWRVWSLGIHLIAAVILTLAEIVLVMLVLWSLGIDTRPVTATLVKAKVVANFYSSFPTYWLILFVVLTLDYQGKYRDRELTAERLERQLAEARLDALRAQLNPHFLFNALNSISSLMYVDAAAADTMIRKLGDLLRVSLNRGRGADIRLRDELNFVQGYLEIERLRFEDRLKVSLEIEEAVLDATVPAFTLQPLVENAVHHAIAPRRGGRVDISAWQDESWLHLAVTDDGPGMPEQLREGLGLANTRA